MQVRKKAIKNKFFIIKLEEINEKFNKELLDLTTENADGKILILGKPSGILLNAGIEDIPLKLYGNKIIKKMKKHGYGISDLENLPIAVADPIAVFKGNRIKNFAILTELKIDDMNVLVVIGTGLANDADFNIISSVYGKANTGIVNWVKDKKLLFLNKEKAPDYLRIPELISGAQNSQESIPII